MLEQIYSSMRRRKIFENWASNVKKCYLEGSGWLEISFIDPRGRQILIGFLFHSITHLDTIWWTMRDDNVSIWGNIRPDLFPPFDIRGWNLKRLTRAFLIYKLCVGCSIDLEPLDGNRGVFKVDGIGQKWLHLQLGGRLQQRMLSEESSCLYISSVSLTVTPSHGP